jgi:hypothetical protein
VPCVLLSRTSLCRVFYGAWQVCAECSIGYDKSVPGVILGVIVLGVLLGTETLCRLFY